MYNPVVLDPKDILQADATVIAGFLVLLTILFVFAPDVEIAPTMKWVKSKIVVPAMIIIGLFSISAILVIFRDIFRDILVVKYLMLYDFARYLTMAGFGALIIGIGKLLWEFRKSKII
jgi:hypothetical protein